MINNCLIVQKCYLIPYLNLWIIKQTMSYERPDDNLKLKENSLVQLLIIWNDRKFGTYSS